MTNVYIDPDIPEEDLVGLLEDIQELLKSRGTSLEELLKDWKPSQ